MIYRLLRPLLFCLPAECSHHLTLRFLKYVYPPCRVNAIRAKQNKDVCKLFGLNFSSRIGLAAGLDKNGDYIDTLWGLGFGFIEVGAVTPKPQPGNAKPRLFRLKKANALINRFGFNNKGVDHLVDNLKRRKVEGVVGVNIGKNATTPLEKALDDYQICFAKVYPYADFVTVNISSPNTKGLRDLQSETYLQELLASLKAQQKELSSQYQHHVPLLVKVSPDLSEKEIQFMGNLFLQLNIEGVIAVNTTMSRDKVENMKFSNEAGGLSGEPLRERALVVVRQFAKAMKGEIPIIGVGGISCKKDIDAMLAAGASLLQVYTGLIYQGPGFISS